METSVPKEVIEEIEKEWLDKENDESVKSEVKQYRAPPFGFGEHS